MELIKTRSKEKLPKGFSYPIGAEQISLALQKAPQYSEINLMFNWKDTFLASKYQNKLKENGQISIIELFYSSNFKEWTLRINAVPKEHAQRVRELIPVTVLNKLASLLEAAPAKIEYFRWDVIYDLTSGKLLIDS